MLRGVVHDPRARRMNGVAGHAGLFSTADDLSKFARALLQGSPVLAANVVEKMTTPQQPPPRRNCEVSGGTSTRHFQAIAATFSPWDRSATPDSPARRSGSIHDRTYIILLTSSVHPAGEEAWSLRSRLLPRWPPPFP
jgi:CubicO group peptidase (beta-lactamase class C family)